MTRFRFLTACGLATTLVLGSASCSDSPGPDDSGPLTVSLTTPNADDGALLVVVTGPELTDIQPTSSAYQVFSRRAGATETRVIVVGDIVAGPVFTASVPTGSVASEFAASMSEVASRTDALRPSTAGYSLTVRR